MAYRSKEELQAKLLGQFAVPVGGVLSEVVWGRLFLAGLVQLSPGVGEGYACADVLRLRTDILCSIIGAVWEDIRTEETLSGSDSGGGGLTMPGVPGRAVPTFGNGFIWELGAELDYRRLWRQSPTVATCKRKVLDGVRSLGAPLFLGSSSLPALMVSVRSLALSYQFSEEPIAAPTPAPLDTIEPEPARPGASPRLPDALHRWCAPPPRL